MLQCCYVAMLLCSMRKCSNTGKKKLTGVFRKFVQKRLVRSFHDEYRQPYPKHFVIKFATNFTPYPNFTPWRAERHNSTNSGWRFRIELIRQFQTPDSLQRLKKKPCINLTRSVVSPTAELKKIPNSILDQNNSFNPATQLLQHAVVLGPRLKICLLNLGAV